MSIENFASLLRIDEEKEERIISTVDEDKSVPRLTAEKSAGLSDFIDMVAKIVLCTMDDDVTFEPDEGKRIKEDPGEALDGTRITYRVINRSPKDGELKPTLREEIEVENPLEDNNKMPGGIYGQFFDCLIQFDIMSNTYKSANKVMEEFEDAMYMYSYYLKRNGVSEILFDSQFTDGDYDAYRQSISIRSIRFKVVIEKLYVKFNSIISEIS